jgi:hypothetical protein
VSPVPVTMVVPPARPGGRRLLAVIAAVAGLGATAVVVVSLRGDGVPPPASETAAGKAVNFEINSVPPGAQVLIDGAPTGLSTPAVLRNLRPGSTLELRLDHVGYHPSVLKVDVTADPTQSKTLMLAPASATLRLDGLPTNAEVYVDDVLTKTTSGVISVMLGKRKLRVESGGEVVFQKVIMAEEMEQVVQIEPAAEEPRVNRGKR